MSTLRKFKETLYYMRHFALSLFTYPKFSSETLSADYESYWKDRRRDGKSHLNEWQQQRADIIVKTLSGKGGVRIADVGCGDGALLAYIKKKLPKTEALCLDESKTALLFADKLGLDTQLFEMQDGTEFKELRNIDYVLLLEVIEHMPNPERILAAALSCARHGVFVSVPNTGYLRHRLRLLFGRFPLQWRVHPGEHLRFWTKRDFEWWLRAQKYTEYQLKCYKGIPVLNKLWPSLFAAGMIVYLVKK